VSTSVTLYDPNLHSRSNSSSSSFGSPESSYLSVSHSPFPSGSCPQFIDFKRAYCPTDSSPPPRSWSQTQVKPFSSYQLTRLTLFLHAKCLPSPSSTPFIPETFFNDHRTQPPTELAQILYFFFFFFLAFNYTHYCLDWIFLLPIAANVVWESIWVVFEKVSTSRHQNKGTPSL
jgi:hypothetical protein